MIEVAVIVRGLTCLLALALAGYLAFRGEDGWGWFLFVALCLGTFNVEVK